MQALVPLKYQQNGIVRTTQKQLLYPVIIIKPLNVPIMKKILLISVIFNISHLYAQDRIFNYTYQSTVLNKGQKELEVWTTLRSGRSNYFRGIDQRVEFEVGLGKKLQTAFYLNYGYSKGIEETNGTQTLNSSVNYSFSNEWKYKLSDPVANVIGSALYFEFGISPSETELEGKIILDKQIGRTLQAFNIVGEYEFETEFNPEGETIDTEPEREAYFELNYAFSYKIKEGFLIGLEARNQNQFSTANELESSVLSLGPCISYYTDGFWLNFTLMPQISNVKGGGLELTEHEKIQARLLFSFAL